MFTKTDWNVEKKETDANRPAKQENPAVNFDGYLKSEEIYEESEWDVPLEPAPQDGQPEGSRNSQRKDVMKEKSKHMFKEKTFIRSECQVRRVYI